MIEKQFHLVAIIFPNNSSRELLFYSIREQ